MSRKLIISKRNQKVITAYLEHGELIEVQCEDYDKTHIIGNIYVGKVKNIVKNIQAAFVDIGIADNAYFSLKENLSLLYTSPDIDRPLKVGDEIVVQVVKEGTKTKGPVVTCQLNLTGRFTVLTVGKNFIGISNKIEEVKLRNKVKNWVNPYVTDDYGFIIRTNAQFVSREEIQEELQSLIARYERIKHIGQYRSCYQLIEKAPSSSIASIRDQYKGQLKEIVVDDEEIFKDIHGYLSEAQSEDLNTLTLYKDQNLSLFDLYSLKSKINNALKPNVWLKSGGYIVINPTEALVVIDVNSGKYSGKLTFEDTVLKINLEAAIEIAKQIRLRNLSGILIIDFIDMKKQENKEKLLSTLEELFVQDPIKTTIIGMTPLNLVELTRKKIKKPIYEQFGQVCPCCSGKGYQYHID